MHRRTFVRVLTAGGAALVTPPPLSGCAPEPSTATQAWSGPSPALEQEDVRLKIVSYGLLAPSIANLQPWWVSLKHSGILVALEPHRTLPHTDANLHQTFVSHGAFIEAMRLAAGTYDLTATVTPFPSDTRTPSDPFGSLVARLDLVPGFERDPLTEQLPLRRTNRRPFRAEPVPSSETAALASSCPAGTTVHWYTAPDVRRMIIDAVLDATQASLDDPDRYRETIGTLRWSHGEIESKRDGITLAHLGLSVWSEWYERLVRSHASVAEGGMKERLLELTRRQAETAAAFGIITTQDRDRRAELAAGAALLRLHLAATSRGIAFQPMNAPLEGRLSLPADLVPAGREPHVLFRVGFAEPPTPSPRRTLFEVVQL